MKKLLVALCLVAFACSNEDRVNQAEATGGAGGNGEAAGSQAAAIETSGNQAGTSGSQAGGAGLGASGNQAGASGSQAGVAGSEIEAPFQMLKSSIAYEQNPVVSTEDADALAAGNSEFAIDLYHALRSESQDSFLFAPYSISAALAMTYAAARNNTEAQMAEALHFTLPQERLNPAFNAMNISLNQRAQAAGGQGFTLNIVNSNWGQKEYHFFDSFLDLLARNYDAGLRLVDFMNAPEESRDIINAWVEDQTEEKIKELLPPQSIRNNTRLVLVNAVYFKAIWLLPFEAESTATGAFTTLNGTVTQTPMMKQVMYTSYLDGQGFTALELRYGGNAVSMLLLVPDAGSFEVFDQELSSARITEIVECLVPEKIALSIPKWSCSPERIALKEILQSFGMRDAFEFNTADLSGMNRDPGTYIDNIYHKAFIEVDETGTEASASTAAVIVRDAGVDPLPPLGIDIDRPFIYLIRDIRTRAILFMGRMLDPSKTQ
ncbi:MAG: serpin family protein [Deltaproteobacteria bacterium]|nr:serpin family protein [Deltaproteobacteria bacterium]